MLELTGVRHVYAGRTVLCLDSLRIDRAARLAIVGPNGSGKSTLLRVLAFLEEPTEGTIGWEGTAVRTAADRRKARRRVTLVEQRPFLFRGTVLENVAWGLRVRGRTQQAAEASARDALALLQAASLAARDVRALSDGEAQRVAVARAVATGPDVLLLDEPVSAADRAAQHALTGALADLQERRGVTICVASHMLEEAYRWADRILSLHEGAPTPMTPENLYRVELPGGSGVQSVRVGALAIDVVSDRAGQAILLIPPDEIVLSVEPFHSSARNHVQGRIVRLAEQGEAVRVTVDAGIELVALVTRRSFDELGLRVGGPVWASFKSVAVRVL